MSRTTPRSSAPSPPPAARSTTTDWPRTAAAERSALLGRTADLIERDHDRIARAETVNTGKAMRESGYDVDDVAKVFRYYARLACADPSRKVDDGRPERRVAGSSTSRSASAG